MPPWSDVTRYPAPPSACAAVAERLPCEQMVMISRSRGTSATRPASTFWMGTFTVPSMCQGPYSSGVRTSSRNSRSPRSSLDLSSSASISRKGASRTVPSPPIGYSTLVRLHLLSTLHDSAPGAPRESNGPGRSTSRFHEQDAVDARRHRPSDPRRRDALRGRLHPPHSLRGRPRDHPPGPVQPRPLSCHTGPDLRSDDRRRVRP